MLECLASCSPVGEEFEEAIIIADGVIEEMDGSDEFRTPTIRSQIAKRKPLTGAKMALLLNEPMQLCAHKCLTSSRERGIF